MNPWESGERPITIAVLAMGGEGGGVLSDWIVSVGEEAGYTAQTTSVAGVAQRTGATVYYVELYPPGGARRLGARTEPVLSLFPTPGQVDIVIASELMEAGRAIQRGFSTPDRTTLIASTNRVFAITEKISLADGRADDERLLAAAHAGSQRLIAADFNELAQRAGSVISASLFGALAGSSALPFGREAFEAALRRSGKGVERSLVAFGHGFDAAQQPAPAPVPPPVAGSGPVPVTIGRRPPRDPEAEAAAAAERRHLELAVSAPVQLVGPRLAAQAQRVSTFPEQSRSMLIHGSIRTAVYQSPAYTDRYLDRVAGISAYDSDPSHDGRLTTAVATQTALWMAYQDTIQVAQQKLRARRLEGVRSEARAETGQLTQIREFLHPQVEEITDTLPTALGRWLSRSSWFVRLVSRLTRNGLVVNTTSILGFTSLWVMAMMRPIRPRSLRFGREQAGIDAWLAVVARTAESDYQLAVEVAQCPRVLKGYGQTHAHGHESFSILMDSVPAILGRPDAADTLRRLREAALADESGAALAAAVSAQPTPAP